MQKPLTSLHEIFKANEKTIQTDEGLKPVRSSVSFAFNYSFFFSSYSDIYRFSMCVKYQMHWVFPLRMQLHST